MPGICAVIRNASSSVEPDIQVMLRRMTHYPWFRRIEPQYPVPGVGLAAVALPSIAHEDVSFVDDASQTTVLLDGEIYDADAERRRLTTAGVTWTGQGDAEVVLRGWTTERDAFFARLHGLFTALIWDGRARTLTIVTDRFGLRPTYVAHRPGAFAVASEIKALLADPAVDRSWSEQGFAQFFAYGYFFNDETFFKGVRALRPASRCTYRLEDGHFEEVTYWRPDRQSPTNAPQLVQALETALVGAVARRAGPGERLGLSLSGGLDARTLLGLMPANVDLTSVSIGIDGSIDHRGASELARIAGVRHHSYMLDGSFLANFERHLRSMVLLTDGHYLDQGIVMTTLPTYRELGIDYLLRGHGGELLHMRKAYAFSLDDEALAASEADLQRWLFTHLTGYMLQGVPPDLFKIDVRARAQESLERALRGATAADVPIDRVWDLFLSARLHRETALSMHKFGCFATVRMPYLDNDVVDALFAMPARMKLGDELQTEMLRHRRPKFLDVVNSNTGARMGAGPLANHFGRLRMRINAKLGVRGYQPYERLGLWLKRELRPMTERLLRSDEFFSRGVFRPDVVTRVLDQHMDGQANHTFLIMSLMIFELGQQMLGDPEGFAQLA